MRIPNSSLDRMHYAILTDRSRPRADREQAARSVLGPPTADEAARAFEVVEDGGEAVEVRVAALAVGRFGAGKDERRIDRLLATLVRAEDPPTLRRAVFSTLAALGFSSSIFVAKRPVYLASLRELIDDPDPPIRTRAIETLAAVKDDYVQRRLVAGLEDPAAALVPPEQAIGLLGYDVHAGLFGLLRRIIAAPPNVLAKREAVRLLSMDPQSKELLVALLRDRGQSSMVRRESATSLAVLDPAEFAVHARSIIVDPQENRAVRLTCVSALGRVGDRRSLRRDDEFNRALDRALTAERDPQLTRGLAKFRRETLTEDT